MPRPPACRNCAEKKVSCKPGHEYDPLRCKRCTQKNLACERPTPVAVPAGPATRKTACDRCRTERVKCEVDANARAAGCRRCVEKRTACSLRAPATSSATTPGGHPVLAVDTAAATANNDSGPGTSSTATRSPSRPFWETVLAPSPGVDQ